MKQKKNVLYVLFIVMILQVCMAATVFAATAKYTGYVVLFGNNNLYTAANIKNKTSFVIAPQSVYANRKIGEWYEINTYKGKMWIKPEVYFEGAKRLFDAGNYTGTVVLFENNNLYTLPNIEKKTNFVIAPQTVYAYRKVGDWYEINTYKGKMWIKSVKSILGKIVKKDEVFPLKTNTKLYGLPFLTEPVSSTLSPQYVKSFEKIDGKNKTWIHIRTWIGDRWLEYTPPIIDKLPPANVTNANFSVYDNSVILSWNKPLDIDFKNVEIYENNTLIGTSSLTNFNIMNPLKGAIHSYKVISVDEKDNKSNGIVIGVTLPLPISDFSESEIQSNSAKFSFSNPEGSISTVIEISKDHATWNTATLQTPISVTSTSETITALDSGTAYDVRLKVSGGVRAGISNIITITTIDPTVYDLELSRWNIYNDGTHPVETTSGINNALIWAHNNGKATFKVPPGTYLIAKGTGTYQSDMVSRINMVSDMTFLSDDNTIYQKESNGFPGYSTLTVGLGIKNAVIKGGTFIGDRDTHDYSMGASTWLPNHEYKKGDKVVPPKQNRYYYVATTDGTSGDTEPAWTWTILSTDNNVIWQPNSVGTHEGGYGIITLGAFNVTITGVKTEKFTGDGICIGGGGGYFQDLYENSFISGSIDNTGKEIIDATKIRTGSYPLTNPSFELTHQVIIDNPIKLYYGSYFDAYFYKADGSFLTKLSNLKRGVYIDIPSGAESFRMVFADVKRPGQYLEIWNRVQSTNILIEGSESMFNRRQGLTIGGGKNVLVQNNSFHDIGGVGGTAPMAGIDIEGGAGDNGFVNDNINIKNNEFYKNSRYDLIFYDGHDGIAQGNHFASKGAIGVAISSPFTGTILKDNWFDGSTILGYHDVTVIGNKMNDGNVNLSGPNSSVDGMLLTNTSINAGAATPYGVSYDNITIHNEADGSKGVGLWGSNPTKITNLTMYGGNIGGDAVPGYVLDNLKIYNNKGFPLQPATYTNCTIEMEPTVSNGIYTTYTKVGTYVIDNCQFNTPIQITDANADVSITNSNFNLDNPKSFFSFSAKKVLFQNNTITANKLTGTAIAYNQYSGLFLIGGYWTRTNPYITQSFTMKGNTITTNLPGIEGIKTTYAGTGAPSYTITDNILYNAILNLKSNDVNLNNQQLVK